MPAAPAWRGRGRCWLRPRSLLAAAPPPASRAARPILTGPASNGSYPSWRSRRCGPAPVLTGPRLPRAPMASLRSWLIGWLRDPCRSTRHRQRSSGLPTASHPKSATPSSRVSFDDVLQQINQERSQIIDGIQRYTRKQRHLADKIAHDSQRAGGPAAGNHARRRDPGVVGRAAVGPAGVRGPPADPDARSASSRCCWSSGRLPSRAPCRPSWNRIERCWRRAVAAPRLQEVR